MKESERLAEYCNIIGDFYYDTNNSNRDLIKADNYYIKAYNIEKAKNNSHGKIDFPLSNSCKNLVKLNIEQGKLKNAAEYFNEYLEMDKSLELSKKPENKKFIDEASNRLKHVLNLKKSEKSSLNL